MDSGVLATTMAGLSLVIAMASAGWNVADWRRAGPVLRVHALLYDDVLVIRVFNAGRTPERIECVVLGGLSHARRGIDMTDALHCPRILEPSASLHEQVDWQKLVPPERQVSVAQSDVGKFQTRAAEMLGGPFGGFFNQSGIRAAVILAAGKSA